MRVLVVSAWSPFRATDGDSLVLAHHLHHLADRHDITVLAADDGDGGDPAGGPLPGSVEVRSFAANRQRSWSVIGRRLRGVRRREPDHVSWVERPALLASLDTEVATRRPDVVYLFGWGTAQLSARLSEFPCVHMPVDGWADGFRNRSLPGWRRITDVGQHRLVAAHERRHYPRCRAVVVVSPGERERLLAQVPGAPVEVVPNGVDPGPSPTRLERAGSPVLALHGSFGTRANQDAAQALVQGVLPLVQHRHPSARVALIGRDAGPDVQSLAGPSVEVTGAVDDIRGRLEAADVYVASMVSGSGIKNKVLEAMAAGLPVAATPLALDGIGDGAGTVVGDDLAALADVVSDLLDDPVAARRVGDEGRERVVSQHGWDRSAALLERIWLAAAG